METKEGRSSSSSSSSSGGGGGGNNCKKLNFSGSVKDDSAYSSALADGACSSNKKPRIDLDGKISAGVGAHANATSLLEENEAVMVTSVLDFLEPSDRLNFAVVSKATYRVVENYCSGMLHKLAEEHKADESFFDRLHENCSERFGAAKDDGTLKLKFPHRYRLEKAKSTYLCKLDMMHGSRSMLGRFAIYNDKGSENDDGRSRWRRLVMVGTPAWGGRPSRPPFENPNQPPLSIYSWDLVEKRLLEKVDIPSEFSEYAKCIFFLESDRDIDNSKQIFVVICTSRRILVSSIENVGEIIHEYNQSTRIEGAVQVDGPNVLFLDHRDDSSDSTSKLRLFNVRTGSSQVLTQLKTRFPCKILALCNNQWLVLYDHKEVLVFDMNNEYRQVSSIGAASYNPPYCASDGHQNTVFAFDRKALATLKVSNHSGQIYRESTVEIFDSCNNESQHFAGKLRNQLFFSKIDYLDENYDDTDDTKKPNIDVVTIPGGALRRSLKFPDNRRLDLFMGMVPLNESELFVGLETHNGLARDFPGTTIAIYLAEEGSDSSSEEEDSDNSFDSRNDSEGSESDDE